MKTIRKDDFDDEDEEMFGRCGRVYYDPVPAMLYIQEDIINDDKEMHDQVTVLVTRKTRSLARSHGAFFVTNYSSDRPPINEWGRLRGSRNLTEPKGEVLWAR